MAAMAPMAPTPHPIGVEPKWAIAAAMRPTPIANRTARSQPGTFFTYSIFDLPIRYEGRPSMEKRRRVGKRIRPAERKFLPTRS
jgi:hypothetical protein